jgi:hypothetical protein
LFEPIARHAHFINGTMRDDENIPDDLARQLRARFSRRIDVPGAIDDAILRGARSHLNRPRRWRRVASFAAAAGVLIGVSLYLVRSPETHPTLAMDINHDQQINILDALTLARRADASTQEIDRIAMASVQLGGVK